MYKVCGEEIGVERRIEKKNKMMDDDGTLPTVCTHSSPRSLPFFRNRESVRLLFSFQPNQESVDDPLDVWHVLL